MMNSYDTGQSERCDEDGGGGEGGIEIAPGVRVGAKVLRFSFSRSSGPGGQNVNKVNTKVELRVRVGDLLEPSGPCEGRVIHRLRRLAGRQITKGDELIVVSDEFRTQGRNKAACMARLRELMVKAGERPRVRRKTKPTRGSVERRLKEKKVRGVVKRLRGRPGGGDE